MALSSEQADGLTFLLPCLSELPGQWGDECSSGNGVGWPCCLAHGSGHTESCWLSSFGMVPVYKQLFGSTCGSEPKALIEKKKKKKKKVVKLALGRKKSLCMVLSLSLQMIVQSRIKPFIWTNSIAMAVTNNRRRPNSLFSLCLWHLKAMGWVVSHIASSCQSWVIDGTGNKLWEH